MNGDTNVRKTKNDQRRPRAKPVKLLLADNHDIVIVGLRSLLNQPDFEIVSAVNDGRALVQAALDLKPDVILAEIAMPLLNGIDAARKIRSLHPDVKIVFVTMRSETTYATEALSLGNCGYVLKSSVAEELPLAIHAVLEGGSYAAQSIAEPVRQALDVRSRERDGNEHLTTRQREVLQLIAEGHRLKEIAFMMGLSKRTVEFHKYKIMDVLGVQSVAEMVHSAIALGMISKGYYRFSAKP
jgi:DNA-binding NarL/FixJ family response regulator